MSIFELAAFIFLNISVIGGADGPTSVSIASSPLLIVIVVILLICAVTVVILLATGNAKRKKIGMSHNTPLTVCPSCGYETKPDFIVCPRCGKKLSGNKSDDK